MISVFLLVRDEDETGVSGTGVVACGMEFTDGHIMMRWLTDTASTVLWDSMDELKKVHGHNGKTRVVYIHSVWPANYGRRTPMVSKWDEWSRPASKGFIGVDDLLFKPTRQAPSTPMWTTTTAGSGPLTMEMMNKYIKKMSDNLNSRIFTPPRVPVFTARDAAYKAASSIDWDDDF